MIVIRRPWYRVEVERWEGKGFTSLILRGLDATLVDYARLRAAALASLLDDAAPGHCATVVPAHDVNGGAQIRIHGSVAEVDALVTRSRVLCGHSGPGTFVVAPAPGSHLGTCSRCRQRVVQCDLCDERESGGPHMRMWTRWGQLVEPSALLPMGTTRGTVSGTGRQAISGYACPSCEYVEPASRPYRGLRAPGSLGRFPGSAE